MEKNANVVIIAGCGIHNDHHKDSQHDGIHRFFLEEGAKVKYIEKTLWRRFRRWKKNSKPSNRSIPKKKVATWKWRQFKIKGVDSTIRTTKGVLENNTSLVILEKIMTHGNQTAKTFLM